MAELPLPAVLIVTAGGLEHGGGIGRMIGYMLDGWSDRPDAPPCRVLDSRGPRVDVAAPVRFLACLLRIAAWAPRRPLVHVHVAGRGSTVRKIIVVGLAKRLGLPVVLHLHDYNYRRFCAALPAWALGRVRAMFRRADLVVVLGRGDAELVAAQLGVDPARIAIQPNAVNAPVPAAAGSAGPTAHILFLGRLSERKGVPELIAALATPRLAALNWRATLAGDGDLDRYRAQARAAGIAERLAFPGWLDRAGTDRLLREASCLVLPSHDEGMAMSVLEGLAYRLCVVCTPVGALAEVIEDGVTGALVRPGDVDGLAEALATVIADPARRRSLADGGHAAFLAAYEARGYAARMIGLYRRAARL